MNETIMDDNRACLMGIMIDKLLIISYFLQYQINYWILCDYIKRNHLSNHMAVFNK